MENAPRWWGLLMGACLVSAVAGCRSSNYGRTNHLVGHTEVVFIGTLHARHLRSETYPLRDVARALEQVRPTAVLVQAPPEELERIALDPHHPWLQALPEVGVATRWAEARGVPVYGISGYAGPSQWASYKARFPDGPEDPVYRQARDYLIRRNAREGGTDMMWLASPLYRRLTAWVDRARDHALAGDPARPDWSRHQGLFRTAISSLHGERVAVVFDARRVWALAETLRSLPVDELDLRAFLPLSEPLPDAFPIELSDPVAEDVSPPSVESPSLAHDPQVVPPDGAPAEPSQTEAGSNGGESTAPTSAERGSIESETGVEDDYDASETPTAN